MPFGQVFIGVQGGNPQTFGVPPAPHALGAVQVPQSIVPPQPSPWVPQLRPAGHVVLGVHPGRPQTLALPPLPQA
jgi:hypothetical protein